jgi:CBS domain-containing protein
MSALTCGLIASRPVVTITPDRTILDAARIMAERDIGFLVLVEPKNPRRAIGVISERDIIRAIARGVPLDSTVDKVDTIGSLLVTVSVDDPITIAVEKMARYRIRHVIVHDRDGNLYGVIAMRDIIGRLSRGRVIFELA